MTPGAILGREVYLPNMGLPFTKMGYPYPSVRRPRNIPSIWLYLRVGAGLNTILVMRQGRMLHGEMMLRGPTFDPGAHYCLGVMDHPYLILDVGSWPVNMLQLSMRWLSHHTSHRPCKFSQHQYDDSSHLG